jgi:hypothetical protein
MSGENYSGGGAMTYQQNECVKQNCDREKVYENYCEPCQIQVWQAQEASRLEQASEGFGYHEREGLIYLAYGNEEE